MAKEQRPKIARTIGELGDLLNDQVDALVAACGRYDRGDLREYRQMAAIIRSLCRDTRMSHSLLGQLGLKERRFLSSSPTIPRGNKLAECHLVELFIRPSLRDKPALWRAVLDGSAMAFVAFDDWWSLPVIVQPDGSSFSRADLVGYVADQDGGVHVDPAIDAAFDAMRRQAFAFTDGRTTTEQVDRPVIREIAHEMIKSLRPSYRRTHRDFGSRATIGVQRFAEVGSPPEQPIIGYHTTAPDAACPCLSGMTFANYHRKGAAEPVAMEKVASEMVAPEGAASARMGFTFKTH